MGLYLEAENQDQWLETHAKPIYYLDEINDDELKICVVDNISFKAYGVAFDDREAEIFALPDVRSKKWFKAKKEDLKDVCPRWNDYIR